MQPEENSSGFLDALTAPPAFPPATFARAGHAAGPRGDRGILDTGFVIVSRGTGNVGVLRLESGALFLSDTRKYLWLIVEIHFRIIQCWAGVLMK